MKQENFLDTLGATPPPDVAGSDTQNRFSYQYSWGFFKLLELIDEKKSFIIAFEYLEDIMVMEAEEKIESVEYYQVKTQDGGVKKLNSLIANSGKTKKSKSPLAKLCTHELQYSSSAVKSKFVFVSNVAFEGVNDNDVCAKDLTQEKKADLIAGLKVVNPEIKEEFLDNLHFHVSDLALNSHDELVHGKAQQLFVKLFGEDKAYASRSWCRGVKDTVFAKSIAKATEVKDQSSLIEKKCIKSSEMYNSLKTVEKALAQRFNWEPIQAHLESLGMGYVECIRISAQWKKLSIDIFNVNNSVIQGMFKKIKNKLLTVPQDENLLMVIQSVFPIVRLTTPSIYPDEYIKAVIIRCYHEKIVDAS